jgi:hypothetical protein
MYQVIGHGEGRRIIRRCFRPKLHRGHCDAGSRYSREPLRLEVLINSLLSRLRWRLRNGHRQRYRLTIGSSGP